CTECDSKFRTRKLLKLHSKGHKKYKCNVENCQDVFDHWTLVRKHKAEQHQPKCPICEKTFKNCHNLKLHITIHDKDRSLEKCHLCNSILCSIKSLKSHLSYKHNNKTVKK
ncbi:hypothetical protein A3Q56_07588, partial [Intoshia linei]